MDTILSLLKFGGILASAVFGGLSLFGENRDEKGKLTAWGRINLGGVLAGGLIAALTLAFELRKARDEAQDQAEAARLRDEKTQELLREVQRGGYPLVPANGMSVSFNFRLPLNHSALKEYRQRLVDAIAKARQHPNKEEFGIPAATAMWVNNEPGNLFSLEFADDSPLSPLHKDDAKLAAIVEKMGVSCLFSRARDFPTPAGVHTGASFDATLSDGRPTFSVDSNAETLTVDSNLIALTKTNSWRNDSTVVSLADLEGAFFFIQMWCADWGTDDVINTRNELSDLIDLGHFAFNVANRHFFISGWQREEVRGWADYSYCLPKKLMSFTDSNLPAADRETRVPRQ